MDIKALILKRTQKDGQVTVRDLIKETGFSRAYLNRFFRDLCDEGKIILIGKANQAHYIPASAAAVQRSKKSTQTVRLRLKNDHLEEDKVLDRIKSTTGIFDGLSENAARILSYAFTEMLNNAIEHSGSSGIEVKMERLPKSLHFTVSDQGVGIFKNIMTKAKLDSPLEAIQELLKGKQTTAPEAHSGEGIFFTSKLADRLVIKSSAKKLVFDNLLQDVVVDNCAGFKGTRVLFAVASNVSRKMEDVFGAYANDAFEFSKTQVGVRLFKMGEEYVSRSQARRILSGLDKFETIILDFEGVAAVGQAFADEIFRVWQGHFPDKKIIVKNSNENIDFMIQRARR